MRIAVLGAGIMGSSVALELARRGGQVTLIDAGPAPFSAASRWNEGKIHLGYLYSGDPSLQTAQALLAGGLNFRRITEELIGTSIEPATTTTDDVYLVHQDSIVGVEAMKMYFEAVDHLVRAHPCANDYLADFSGSQVLQSRELEMIGNTRHIFGGFRVPERSVNTNWIADRYIDAIDADQRIEQMLNTRVIGVKPTEASIHGRWAIQSQPPLDGAYDVVINALWEGKLAVDAQAGVKIQRGWLHRYRLALFLRTSRRVEAPNAVLALGPFGDLKNYSGNDFYLSWYPAGLVAEGKSLHPPTLPLIDDAARETLVGSVITELGRLIPSVNSVMAAAKAIVVQGGWVFAVGHGLLSDSRSTLHRRYAFGVQRHGSYVSIDTGKYSVAPWLARRLSNEILG
jgi:hypothetical protein